MTRSTGLVRRVWRAVLLATLLSSLCACASRFDSQGHRGARGLAPENTMAAFEKALAEGVDTLETDLGVTRDDVLVLSHDSRLNPQLTRGADGRWLEAGGPAIRSLTLSELRRYDVGRLRPGSDYARQWPQQQARDGEPIPTLDELLRLVRASPRRISLNLETKITPTSGADVIDPEAFAALVVRAVRESGLADSITIQSFDWRTLVAVKRLAPELATACLTIETERSSTVRPGPDGASPWHAGLRSSDHGGSVAHLVKAAGCGTWSMFWRDLTAQRVQQAHELGLRVLPWTVNEPEDMRRLIAWGVDGLITDYPDRLRRVRALP